MAHRSFTGIIPADVAHAAEQEYALNYATITRGTDKLMLFACDQKIEHLNQDFYGTNIHPDAAHPEHFFKIAHQGSIGAFATQLGLIARYGKAYPGINYIVKLNGKTDLLKPEQRDPFSQQLWTVDDVINFKHNSGFNIRGIGYTIYLGSEYEDEMLSQAAQAIYEAHQHGLVTVLWIYPRGKAVTDDQEPQLVAGAAGVATALGSDFVKIKAPHKSSDLAIAVAAAGNTGVICSGGKQIDPHQFLTELHEQLTLGNTRGSATGRNIFQKSLPQAIALTKAISALVYDGCDSATALAMYARHQ